MKIKFIYILILLHTLANCLYSQDTIRKEEKIAVRPLSFDSAKTFEEQFTQENQYQYIGLQLYLPPVLNPDDGPILFSKAGGVPEKGNRYFTIIDILKEDVTEQLKKKNTVCQCGYRFKNIDSLQKQDLIIFVVFVLRDNSKKDSLNNSPVYWVVTQRKQAPYSCSYFNSFIAIPYFEKQKLNFQDQNIIYVSNKSKWFCKDVVLSKGVDTDSKDSIYDVFCVLVNEKGEKMQLRPPSDKFGRNFMTEKEYTWLDHASRIEKEALYKAINDKQEKRKSECVNKFGQHDGELVALSTIELGMTTDMCKAAWDAPWYISKIKTLSVTKETWFYNWKYTLYFENGILVKIEH